MNQLFHFAILRLKTVGKALCQFALESTAVLLAGYGTCFAADSSAPNPTSSAAPVFIIWLVCFLRRKKPIGGWLLFYFISIWLSLIVSFALSSKTISYLALPHSLADCPLFLSNLGAILSFALLTVEFVLSIILMTPAWRAWKYVLLLRKVLVTSCVVFLVSFALDLTFSGYTFVLDLWALTLSVTWWFYFRRSTRVHRVFHSTDSRPIQEEPSTSAAQSDKQYTQQTAVRALDAMRKDTEHPGSQKPREFFLTVSRLVPEFILFVGSVLIVLRLVFPPKYVLVRGTRLPYTGFAELYPSVDYQLALMHCLAVALVTGVVYYILRRAFEHR